MLFYSYRLYRAGAALVCVATLYLFLIQSASAVTESRQIVIPRVDVTNAEHANYFVELLALAMSQTANESPFKIKHSNKEMSQGRIISALEQGVELDVIWTMTSKQRESRLLPIRIPLLKGMMGYRIFLIRAEDQLKFSNIKTLDQLKRLKAGQGTHWPDTKILLSNGLDVVTTVKFELLFPMLESARFDYFPRGINEAWVELQHHGDKRIMVEPSILLKYPAPMYFFVQRSDTALAERIERGLIQSIKDGSFDRLFYSFPAHQAIFNHKALRGRKIFELSNPYLSEATPINNPDLWFTPEAVNRP